MVFAIVATHQQLTYLTQHKEKKGGKQLLLLEPAWEAADMTNSDPKCLAPGIILTWFPVKETNTHQTGKF